MTAPQPKIPHPDADTAAGAGPSATRGLPRMLRVGVLGGASLGLATVAHLVGGGRLPSPGVLTVGGLLLGLSAVTFTAKRCRFRLLLPVLAVQQVLLHLLFEASASATTCGLSNGGMAHSAGALSCGTAAEMAPMSAPSWAMWVGHLTATLLTAWLLARGEAWLWRAARQIVQAATAAPTGPGAPRPAAREVAEPLAKVASLAARSPAAPRAPPKVVVVF